MFEIEVFEVVAVRFEVLKEALYLPAVFVTGCGEPGIGKGSKKNHDGFVGTWFWVG